VTADPQGGLSIAWNAIDLPRTLTTGSGTGTASTQRGYLADGTLAQVSGGTVKGKKGLEIDIPSGTTISPTEVEIIRPEDMYRNMR
jgi:hypothetical protein